MSDVLRKLQREVFVLSLADQLDSAPELDGYEACLREDGELEVATGPSNKLNELFQQLSDRKITVLSMRNKANRLEELFVRLVENKQSGASESDT